MSHLAKIEMKVKNLDSLAQASKNLGGVFNKNQTEFKWYSIEKGKCDHAISFKGASYEIGVIKEGSVYNLSLDNFYSGGLPKFVGNNAGLLKQEYNSVETKRAAMLKGLSTKETKGIKEGTRTKTRIEIYVK